MDKRWQQIKEIFESASRLAPEERAAFLRENCPDEELRREIESLLANSDEAKSFLEKPAIAEIASVIIKAAENGQAVQSLNHYKIISKLGAGGMGEVYLAEDTRLRRKVAVKLLPEKLAADRERLRRFEQEAQAASALNHPNILTIYEFGAEKGVHFLAAEYVEGETLRERLRRQSSTISEALDTAVQIASALAAAHEAKIIHRDIKPENIMIRRDRLVKVLDFGLAKLTEQRAETLDAEAETRAQVNTAPGVIVGTVSYMSPEQARGKATDARSDVWSVGVVIYEMVAGANPFGGETIADSIAAVINKKPAPLSKSRRDVPANLEDIVSKCLEKDADERYQTSKDLLIDLRRLKKRLELADEMDHSSATPEKANTADNSALNRTEILSNAPTNQTQLHTTSSAEVLVSEIKRHKIGFVIALSVFALLVAAGVFGLYKFVSQAPPVPQTKQTNSPAFGAMKITKLTDTGKAEYATISPDGKYVVHNQIDGAKESLWMRHVATDSNVRIIPPGEDESSFERMTFSPDGNFIYFVRYGKTEQTGTLYRIPVLGGELVKILSNIASGATFSPDGKQIAFIRTYEGIGDTAIIVANADGMNERQLVKRNSTESFRRSQIAWSPDGKRIAASLFFVQQYKSQLAEINVEDGSIKTINQDNWSSIGRMAWLPDGSGLLATAKAKGSQNQQIYLFSYPGGEARRVTNDTNNYDDLSLNADASELVTTQETRDLNIWTLPLSSNATQNNESQARQITNSGNRLNGAWGVAVSPDGKIIYTSNVNGKTALWICSADGTNPKHLVENEGLWSVAVSPDGRFIVVAILGKTSETEKSNEAENLWRINADGSNFVKLTNGFADEGQSFTPDGRWLVYRNYNDWKVSILKVPIEGGEPVQIFDKEIVNIQVSPDGKWILGKYRENANEPYKAAIIPLNEAGGERKIQFLDAVPASAFLRWTQDERAIAYVSAADGEMNVWTLPLAGGAKARQLTNFKSQYIEDFAVAPDGKSIVLSRGTETNDVVLISNFK